MRIITIPARSQDDTALAVHAGALNRSTPPSATEERDYDAGLRRALASGEAVLHAGGSALDAVCAAVVELEDDAAFNAAHGAVLTSDGTAELDAAVMSGAGGAGAIAGARTVRNPVLAARSVLARTGHVLIISPDSARLSEWGLEQVPESYFVTEHRLRELEDSRTGADAGTGHGTVGAVARDAGGHVAAATSTGGITGQLRGRVGDSPVVGAGTYANDATVAVSCTGQGEYFLRGVVAYDISARIAYGGADLGDAVRQTVTATLEDTGGYGGLIAVGPDGRIVLAYNSDAMLCGHLTDDEPRTYV
jgi:beta-aspartyl-peptidase (threonine type)